MRWMISLFGIGWVVCPSAATAQVRTSTLRQNERIVKQNDQNEISRKIYREAYGDRPAPQWHLRTPESRAPAHPVRSGLTKDDFCSLDAVARHETCFRGKLIDGDGTSYPVTGLRRH